MIRPWPLTLIFLSCHDCMWVEYEPDWAKGNNWSLLDALREYIFHMFRPGLAAFYEKKNNYLYGIINYRVQNASTEYLSKIQISWNGHAYFWYGQEQFRLCCKLICKMQGRALMKIHTAEEIELFCCLINNNFTQLKEKVITWVENFQFLNGKL